MAAIILKGGFLIDPETKIIRKADIWIEHGRISKICIAEAHQYVPKEWEAIDCDGLFVVPGLIDIHVHGRTPGQEHKETLATLSMSALAGGFTSVVAMANTSPAIDNPEILHQLLVRAETDSLVAYYQVAAATIGRKGVIISPMLLLHQGAIGFSDDGDGIQDPDMLKKTIEGAHLCQRPLMLHCQDKRFDTYDQRAEIHDISIATRIAEASGYPIHIQHASCAGSVQLIREAKSRGVQVTCETAPHYIALTQRDFKRIGANAKMNPPLRGEADRLAVIQGLVDGTIDAIATDHAPHSDKEKQSDNPPFGIIGLETAVPVVFTFLKRYLTVPEIVAKMTINPARILGLEQKGQIKEGWSADITVIDPKLRKVLRAEDLQSKSHNSPWLGSRLQNWPVLTIRSGKIMMRDGKIIL